MSSCRSLKRHVHLWRGFTLSSSEWSSFSPLSQGDVSMALPTEVCLAYSLSILRSHRLSCALHGVTRLLPSAPRPQQRLGLLGGWTHELGRSGTQPERCRTSWLCSSRRPSPRIKGFSNTPCSSSVPTGAGRDGQCPFRGKTSV